MDALTSETCWAVNWHNKASVIKLVSLYSDTLQVQIPVKNHKRSVTFCTQQRDTSGSGLISSQLSQLLTWLLVYQICMYCSCRQNVKALPSHSDTGAMPLAFCRINYKLHIPGSISHRTHKSTVSTQRELNACFYSFMWPTSKHKIQTINEYYAVLSSFPPVLPHNTTKTVHIMRTTTSLVT